MLELGQVGLSDRTEFPIALIADAEPGGALNLSLEVLLVLVSLSLSRLTLCAMEGANLAGDAP
jgi:hypothetical protein